MRAIDVSAFQGEVSDASWQAYAASGIRLAIIQGMGGGNPQTGIGPNIYAQSQAAGALRAGMALACYSVPATRWNEGVAAFGPYIDQLLFVALDIEAVTGYPAGVSRALVDEVKESGYVPVIYTSQYEWGRQMGNTTLFADVPLWDARYWDGLSPDATPDLHGTFVRYGGWTDRVGWQFRGDVTYHGERVDISVFDDAWVAGLQEEHEFMGFTDEEKAALHELVSFREQITFLDRAAKTALLAVLEKEAKGFFDGLGADFDDLSAKYTSHEERLAALDGQASQAGMALGVLQATVGLHETRLRRHSDRLTYQGKWNLRQDGRIKRLEDAAAVPTPPDTLGAPPEV